MLFIFAPPARTGNGPSFPGDFQTPLVFPGGSSLIAVGDFNNDGKIDIVSVGSGTMSVSLGHGDGTFTAPKTLSVGAGDFPVAVVVDDFNHDGKQDLAVANFNLDNLTSGDTVSVLLGNGDGTFQAAIHYGVGKHPIAIAVGDFNNDGKQDLVTANSGDNTVSVLLGDGNGTFQTAVNSSAGNSPHSVASADFNGDGKLDLVVTNCLVDPSQSVFDCSNQTRVDDTITVLQGNGDGSFGAPARFRAGVSPYTVVLGDLNGDGNIDLAVLDHGAPIQQGNTHTFVDQGFAITIFEGNGKGVFSRVHDYPLPSVPTSIAVADFNSDRKLDLVVNGGSFSERVGNGGQVVSGAEFYELLGNGDGSFQAPVSYLGPPGSGFAELQADLNGDGRPDLIASGQDSTFNVSLNADRTTRTATSLGLENTGSDGFLILNMRVMNAGGMAPSGVVTIIDNGVTVSSSSSSTPNVSVLDATGATFFSENLAAGPHQIVAIYSGDDKNMGSVGIVTVTATPDFGVGATASSLTLKQGQSGTIGITVTSLAGFNSSVAFSCSGLPALASCSFAPSTIIPSSPAGEVTLTVSTVGLQTAELRSVFNSRSMALACIWVVGIFVLSIRRNRWGDWALAITIAFASGIVGCGGGDPKPPAPVSSVTPLGTSHITVVGTSGSGTNTVSHSLPLTITVTQ